jgi:transposase
VTAGGYDTDSPIGVLNQLRRFLGGHEATLVWDGLGAYRSRAMRAFLITQRDWLVVERLPTCAFDLNPVEALWSNLKGQELANLACDKLGELITVASQGSTGSARPGGLPYSFLRRAGLSVS